VNSPASRLTLYIAWLIALLCLVITIFSSEVFHLPVCHLCWYQRICLYPLAIILGIAAFADDTKVVKYALPLSILAILFALYQYLQQMIPNFAPIQLCGSGPDCSDIHFKWLGFITYPFLSMCAAIAISILLILAHSKGMHHEKQILQRR
jgi:disulfide bond formation protein DsbB